MCKHNKIKPLSCDDIIELQNENLSNLLIELDDGIYCIEDLYKCETCEQYTADPDDIDEEGYCEYCANEYKNINQEKQLISDYYTSIL